MLIKIAYTHYELSRVSPQVLDEEMASTLPLIRRLLSFVLCPLQMDI